MERLEMAMNWTRPTFGYYWTSGPYTIKAIHGTDAPPYALLKNRDTIGGSFPTLESAQAAAERHQEREVAKMADKPDIVVTLKPGTWLVDVHPGHPPRIWRFTGEGFEGEGSKIRRAEVARSVGELLCVAQNREGL